jgi:hypothetical protein
MSGLNALTFIDYAGLWEKRKTQGKENKKIWDE